MLKHLKNRNEKKTADEPEYNIFNKKNVILKKIKITKKIINNRMK